MKEMKVPPPKMTYFVLIQNLSKKMHTTLMKECFGTDFTDWKISASIIRFWKNLGGGGSDSGGSAGGGVIPWPHQAQDQMVKIHWNNNLVCTLNITYLWENQALN